MAEQRRPDIARAGSSKKAKSPIEECSYKFWIELEHCTEYLDDRGQVEPAANTPFRVTFGDGRMEKGELDHNGFARFDGIPKGDVQVEYEPDIDEKLAELQRQLKQGLDEIVADERAEYQRIEKELQDARVLDWEFLGSNTIAKSGIYTGALLKGVGNGVLGLLSFAWDVIKGCGKVLYELSLRTNPITAPEKFKEDLQALKAAHEELKRFANEDLEAYAILMSEPSTYTLFQNFGEEFLAAQHSLEMTEGGGELVFDVALAIITGGAGAAASARHGAKLKKLKVIIDKLVDALKRKKRRQRLSREPHNRRIITKVQLRKVPCFCPYNSKAFKRLSPQERKAYLQEYDRQLRRQEDALNRMTTDDYLAARDAFKKYGRNPLADELQEGVREDYRKEIQSSIMKSMRKQNPALGAAEAKRQAGARADAIMKSLAALHEPDTAAGGWSKAKPEGVGNSGANSSIGASWNQKRRLATIDEQAVQARRAGHGQKTLNIRLEVCRGKRYCP